MSDSRSPDAFIESTAAPLTAASSCMTASMSTTVLQSDSKYQKKELTARLELREQAEKLK